MFKLPENIDKSWTLFLDRDGVINEKLESDYIKYWPEFKFKEGSLDALKRFSDLFGLIIVITNQQGIGKGLMAIDDLEDIHSNMIYEIRKVGGRIDQVQFCPHLADEGCSCRKPETQMALDAQLAYPEIDFSKSLIIGDSDSDIELGKRLGMKTIKISSDQSLLSIF